MIALQAQELSKAYGSYRIFEGVTFEISGGQCVALFGANGAGKTTLLKVLATLVRPTSGQFSMLGHNGLTDRDAVRHAMMFLAHGAHLYDDLNASENLRFAMALRGLTPTGRELKTALDRVGLGAFGDMKTRNYSAGMKRRLALAKTFVAQPQVLLLDEPYNALDDTGVTLTNQIIHEIVARDGVVFMTTHDKDKAERVAHRTGTLQHGVLAMSPPAPQDSAGA